MRRQLLALAASLTGLGVSIYLTIVHFSSIQPACPANAAVNCEQVLTSAYAVIGGSSVPTSAAGILWFAVSAVLAAALLAGREGLARAQMGWAAAGLATVLFLVYVEIVRLGVVCVWCSAAHLLVLVIFLVSMPGPKEGRVRP